MITCKAWSKLIGEEAVATEVVLMLAEYGIARKIRRSVLDDREQVWMIFEG
jgi:hypothetical protein